MNDLRSWKGRRVFVTGHTGFKGSWLTLWLHELGAKVHGYALDPPTNPSLFDIAKIGSALTEDTRADIRDAVGLDEALRRAQPDVVFHLAAQPLVRLSYAIPVETFDVNVIGTANLLQAIQQIPSVRAALIVTSDKCYENRGSGQAHRETDALGGRDPYSASKACAEIVTTSFRASIGAVRSQTSRIAIASARAGNVIGGGDWSADRLVPDCVRSIINGEPVKLRYPQAVRPWLHVLEPLSGYLSLADRLLGKDADRYATAFNFGPSAENDANVLEVAQNVVRIWGDNATIEVSTGPHPPEAETLRLDTTKAGTLLGWRARWNLVLSLERTVEWYKAWHQRLDVRPIMMRQLSTFVEAGG